MSALLRMVCAGLLVVATCAQAVVPGAGVRARLVVSPVLRGQFEQEKHLQDFKHPLLSKGDFLIDKGRGLVWATRSPFASTLVLTKDKLLVRRDDGSATTGAGPGASPAVATANSLLLALLGGDVDALSRQFTLTETLSADQEWRLQLVPKRGPLARIFKRIQLQGDQHVRSVRLEEVRGDVTEIRFLQLRDAPTSLSADEARQFD